MRFLANGQVAINNNSPIASNLFTVTTNANSGIAVYGENTNTTNGIFNVGIKGYIVSDSGAAVYGIHNYATGTKIGMGVYGTSNSRTGVGVYGENTDTDTSTTGQGIGVYGGTMAKHGVGVYGVNNANIPSQSVDQLVKTPQGYNINIVGVGVHGEGYNGVTGLATDLKGFGVLGLNFQIPHLADTSLGTGVMGLSKGIGIAGIAEIIGVYGEATTDSSLILGKYIAGYFAGDVYTNSVSLFSDERFKKNIKPINSALAKIMQIQPKQYEYRTDEYPAMHFDKNINYGFIAQELEKVLPELTDNKTAIPDPKRNKNSFNFKMTQGYYSVNYIGLIPVMVKAIQEQQQQIEELKKLNQEMQKKISMLELKR
jgi:hypothetical protein